MSKIDITKNPSAINQIITVIKSQRKMGSTLHNSRRRSDAFIYVLSGGCTYSFDDSHQFTAKKGDIIYLAARANYSMRDTPDENYSYIYCDFEFFKKEERQSDCFSPGDISTSENLFYKLYNCFSHPSKNSFAECMSLLYGIYSIILNLSNTNYVPTTSRQKMNDIKEYIDSNFISPTLCVSSLAARAEMSETYFRKLFKLTFATTPIQYITSVRLKKAKELMQYPFLSLEECALQSGFTSLQYFCHVFKKATGTTPAKYRIKNC